MEKRTQTNSNTSSYFKKGYFMSKFNTKSANANKTLTHEGAVAYKKDVVDAWFNMLFSSYAENHCYESANSQVERFIEYTEEVALLYGADFVAKAAIFARNALGMRSISHILAAWLNNQSFEYKRIFFRNFCNRPDDVSEVFAAIQGNGDKRSHAMIRGFGDYLSTLSSYTLGKYKLNGHNFNMYDLINITHAHSAAIDSYKNEELEIPDTWEVKISTAENEIERQAEWRRLVEEKKLGYLALIRNLRNILNADVDVDWIDAYLIPQITNEQAIHKSLVFPYQIYTAAKQVPSASYSVLSALEKAFIIACDNMPSFDGKTAILLDVSGSMDDNISKNSIVTIKEVGACFAASLFYMSPKNTTFIKFGNRAKAKFLKKAMNPFALIDAMCDNEGVGYGTEVDSAFEVLTLLDSEVDRIFLISDMQTMSASRGWYCRKSGYDIFKDYCEETNTHPKIFSFDLGNYHSQITNPKDPNVHLMTALNDQIFKIIKILDSNISMVDFINRAVNL